MSQLTSSISFWRSSCLPTWQTSPWHSSCSFLSFSIAFFTLASLRLLTTTLQPSSANLRAMANPILIKQKSILFVPEAHLILSESIYPSVEAVTTATLLANLAAILVNNAKNFVNKKLFIFKRKSSVFFLFFIFRYLTLCVY